MARLMDADQRGEYGKRCRTLAATLREIYDKQAFSLIEQDGLDQGEFRVAQDVVQNLRALCIDLDLLARGVETGNLITPGARRRARSRSRT